MKKKETEEGKRKVEGEREEVELARINTSALAFSAEGGRFRVNVAASDYSNISPLSGIRLPVYSG